MSDKIICPYCQSVSYDDDRVHANDFNNPTTCDSCGKTFLLTGYVEFSYQTIKVPCSHGHNWGRITRQDIDQAMCDKWKAEKFLPTMDHQPHRNWLRTCIDCETQDIQEVPPGGKCPWPLDYDPGEEIPY